MEKKQKTIALQTEPVNTKITSVKEFPKHKLYTRKEVEKEKRAIIKKFVEDGMCSLPDKEVEQWLKEHL